MYPFPFVVFLSFVAVSAGSHSRSTTAPAAAPPSQAASERADVSDHTVNPSRQPHIDATETWRLLRSHVKYVFVIYQENRSFDSYFGTFPGADGLFSKPPAQTPGFNQELINTDGSVTTIHPFRIGPKQFAADTDDIDHSHKMIVQKMDVVDGHPNMDRFAFAEERKHSPHGNPSLSAKQFGELSMAYMDGDTIPLLWRYADRFVLFDHIFQLMTGASTLGNLSIIAAQTGQTQWMLHPHEASLPGSHKGVPVLNDDDPLWGSILDPLDSPMPTNPQKTKKARKIQINLKFASLPLTLQGAALRATATHDADPQNDLDEVHHDITAITQSGDPTIGFGWYQEGYDRETVHHDDGDDDDDDPVDASGLHASYITHHNGPQYFGYISNNPKMRKNLHGLQDFYTAIKDKTLPAAGGVFYIKGGYVNELGLKAADPNPIVQKRSRGDDDHPGYSNSQISEISVAKSINRIAASPYWNQCAIILTWDDSEGDYDHVPPTIHSLGPDELPLSDGPRVPLLVISPWSRVHYVAHAQGDHASVVKFVDHLFNLIPLAELPDELAARKIGQERYGQSDLGPADALTPDVTDLLDGFDPARLAGTAPPLPASYAMVPDKFLHVLPQQSGYGCKQLGIVPVDRGLGVKNDIPADFNPRPATDPTRSRCVSPRNGPTRPGSVNVSQ